MEMHNFPGVVKVQRFCLNLTGEARLWYESLRPIVVNWQGLQDQFRQQYSKIGNTWEQLFHAWRSFHYDENAVIRCKCGQNKTSSSAIGLWGTADIRGV